MARLIRWIVPIVGLGALQLVAVTSVQSTSDPTESDHWYPRTVGTTWVYASRSNGQDSGAHIAQVVARGSTTDGAAAVIEHRWDNLLGLGPSRQVQYLGEDGGRLLLHGQRANGSYTGYDPPQPQWQESLAPGDNFTWTGTYGVEQQRVTTTLEGREDMVVAGTRQPGCDHYRSTIVVTKDTGDVERSYEAWLCPGLGPVRTAERAPDAGVLLEEDLVAFRSPEGALGAVTEPGSVAASQPGETPGVDNERTGAVPAGAVDLRRVAWSDGRKEQVKFPPVGREDLVVVAEQDGTVSATRPTTGEVVWRVVVPGPVPVSPVIAGSLVIVAGADKVLSAFDAENGLPHWAVPLPDVPAVAPLATADTVVVAGQDRRVRALRLADGGERWVAPTGDVPGAPPALAGGLVVVADKAGGVAALRISDGAVQWSTALERRLTAGPATAGDRVIVVDKAGIVSAFDSASGDLRWSRYVELDILLPVVVAGDTVLVAPNSDRLLALDRRTGERRWQVALGTPTDAQPLVVGDSVLVSTRGDVIERRSLAEGSLVESVPLTSPTPASDIAAHLPPVWVGGRVVATFDLELPWPRTAMFAFGGGSAAGGGVRLTGELRPVPGLLSGLPRFLGSDLVAPGLDNTVSVVPLAGDARTLVRSDAAVTYAVPAGDLVLTTQGQELVALPAGGGEPRWRLPAGEGSTGSEPAAAGDTVVAPVAGVGLVAASLATGTPKWVYQAAGEGAGSPIILPGGDVLYGVGGLVRLDGATGRPRWSVPGVTVYGPMAVGAGVVVLAAVTAQSSSLLAVDLATGQERWRRPFAPALLVGPAASDGTVVAVDATGRTVALDAMTGRPLWSWAMRTAPGGTPVILGDKVVLSEAGRDEDFSSRDTRLSVHDLSTGRYLGSLEPPGFALVKGTFGATGGSIVTYTIAGGSAVLVLRPQ